MAIQKVLVTGSDGRIGQVVVQELREHGYEVTCADLYPAGRSDTKVIDCEDLGQVLGVMQGHDAVIHLAAIPSAHRHTNEVVFRNNIVSHFNVLEAATMLGIKKLVVASSISALGYVFMHRHFNPLRVPIDESHPLLSQDSYGLSKMAGETLCEGFVQRVPDMSIVSLRFSAVIDDAGYERLVTSRNVPAEEQFSGSFWTFVDVRDVATSCRLPLEHDISGHEAFFINAPIIFRDEPIEDLLRIHFPGDYPIADHIRGNVSPVDCSKAERMLAWRAKYNWDRSLLSN